MVGKRKEGAKSESTKIFIYKVERYALVLNQNIQTILKC